MAADGSDVTIKISGDASAIIDSLGQLGTKWDETFKAMSTSLDALVAQQKTASDQNEQQTKQGTLSALVMSKAFDTIKESALEAAHALPEMVRGAAELGDQLRTLSIKTDVSVEDLSKFRYVASQTNTSFESIARAVQDMGKRLEAGTGQTKAILDRLGLSITDLNSEDKAKAFTDIMQALGEKIPDAAKRGELGAQLFGNRFRNVAQLTKEDMKGLMDQADKMGIGMSTAQAEAANKYNASLDTMNKMMETTKNQIGFALMEPMTKLLEKAPDFGGGMLVAASGLKTLGEAAGKAATEFLPLLTNAGKVTGEIGKFGPAVKEALPWISTLAGAIVAGFRSIGAAAASAAVAAAPWLLIVAGIAATGAMVVAAYQAISLNIEELQRKWSDWKQSHFDDENLIKLNKAMGTSYTDLTEAVKHYQETHKPVQPVPKEVTDSWEFLTQGLRDLRTEVDALEKTDPKKVAGIAAALQLGMSVKDVATASGASEADVGEFDRRVTLNKKLSAEDQATANIKKQIGLTGVAAAIAANKAETEAAKQAAMDQKGFAEDNALEAQRAAEAGQAKLDKIMSDARRADAAEDAAVRAGIVQQRISTEEKGLQGSLHLIQVKADAEVEAAKHTGDTQAEIDRKTTNIRLKQKADEDAAIYKQQQEANARAIDLAGEQKQSEIRITEDGLNQQLDLLDAQLATQIAHIQATTNSEEEINNAKAQTKIKQDELVAQQEKKDREDERTALVAEAQHAVEISKVGVDKELALEKIRFDEELHNYEKSAGATTAHVNFLIEEEKRKVQGIKDADAGTEGSIEARAAAAGYDSLKLRQAELTRQANLHRDMLAQNAKDAAEGQAATFSPDEIDAVTVAWKKAEDAVTGYVSAESAGYQTHAQIDVQLQQQSELLYEMENSYDEETGKRLYNADAIDKQRAAVEKLKQAQQGGLGIMAAVIAGLDTWSSKLQALPQSGAKAAGGIMSLGSTLLSAKKTADASGHAFGDLSVAFDSANGTTQRATAGISAGMGMVSGAMDVFASYSQSASKGVNTLNGAMAGAKAGAQFGPWGAAVGAAAGALTNFIRSLTAGRKAVEDFAKTQGGFDALHDKLSKLGDQGEKLWVTLTQGTNKGDPKQAAANIALVTKALDDNAKAITKLNTAQNTQLQGLLAIAPVYQKLPDDVAQYVDQLTEAGMITQQNADQLKSLGENGPDTWQRLQSEAQKYGIEESTLGATFQQQKLTSQATDLIKTFDDLTKNGADYNGVLNGMSDEISGIATNSLKFGTEIPGNMKPWIEQLAASGQLLDDNGNKITDISGMKFGDNIKVGLDDVVDKLQEMIDLMKNGLPKAVDNTTKAVNSSADAFKDFGDTGVKAASDVAAAVDGVSFGHSPGGLKEWVPMLLKSKLAVTEFSKAAVAQISDAQDAVDALNMAVEPSLPTDPGSMDAAVVAMKQQAKQADLDTSASALQSVMNAMNANNAVHLAEGAIQIDRPILKDRASIQELAIEVSKQLSTALRPTGAWAQ